MRSKKLYFILGFGVVCVGFSSILIRLTDASPIVVATYRLALSAIMVLPVYLSYKNKITLRESLSFIPLSIFLAAHFILWISSLEFTTVASSTVLVTTNPVFTPIFSYLFYHNKIRKELIWGIVVAMSGSVFIALSSKASFGLSGNLFGDILALLGAVAFSLYLTVGKGVREKFELLPFIFFTYTFTAIILLCIALITRQNLFIYPKKTYFMLFLVAFIPQILGHTSYNYSLKYLNPSFLAVTLLGEPVIATVAAFFILKETPSMLEIIGALLILTGIYISARSASDKN